MPILNIDNMKVVSPSPNNFILDLDISGKHYNYIASGEHIYQNSDGSIDNELLENHVAHSNIIHYKTNLLYVCNDTTLFKYNKEFKFFKKVNYDFGIDSIVGSVVKHENNYYLMVSEKSIDNPVKRKIQFYKIDSRENIIKLGSLPYIFDARGLDPIHFPTAPRPASIDSYFGFSVASDTLMYATYSTARNCVDESREYGTNGPGIFRSTDGGNTWELLENSPRTWNRDGATGSFYSSYQCIVALKNTDTVFAMSLDNICKSTDGGESWTDYTPHSCSITPHSNLNCYDFDTIDGITFYCYTQQSNKNYIYKIIKRSGEEPEWIKICDIQMPRLVVGKIFVVSENEFYVNGLDGFYHTIDGGQHLDFIDATGIEERVYDISNPVYDHCGEIHSIAVNTFEITKPLFSLFDMNDMGITTDDEDIDNLLLMPNANTTPYERDLSANFIPIHGINCNAVYGFVRTEPNKSFGFPKYNNDEFVMSTHNKGSKGNPEPGTTDTLTLYKYREMATSVSNILGLGKQTDISAAENGFDKMFVFDPTDDNKIQVQTNLRDWRSYQTNHGNGGFTNNFDNSTLLARAILFPKQTLNNEYSTERIYVPNTEVSAPFKQARRYNFKNEDYFYSNGTHIILNHRDDDKYNFIKPDTDKRGGTMVTSTYSRRFGDEFGKEHQSPNIAYPNNNEKCIESDNGEMLAPELDYNVYGTFEYNKSEISNVIGLYNQYSPELINRENETMSDTALMTARHKTNIFDIEFKNGLWKDIADNLKTKDEDQVSAYQEIKDNLKQFIKTNLFKLVEEIKPAHTELYKITFDDET